MCLFEHANEKFFIKFPKVFKFLESFQPKVSGKFPINTSSFQKLLESFQPIVKVSGKCPPAGTSNRREAPSIAS